MSHVVTGAAAVVEMDDGKTELNTGRKVYVEENVQIPEGVKAASIEHLLSVGLIAEVKDEGKPSSKS